MDYQYSLIMSKAHDTCARNRCHKTTPEIWIWFLACLSCKKMWWKEFSRFKNPGLKKPNPVVIFLGGGELNFVGFLTSTARCCQINIEQKNFKEQ